MTINPTKVKQLREEILAALKPIAEKHGLIIDKANANYSSSTASLTLGFSEQELDENGVNLVGEYATAYLTFQRAYDLPSGILGKVFVNNGKQFAFAGIALKRSKYPFAVVALATGEKSFMTDGPSIRKQLGSAS